MQKIRYMLTMALLFHTAALYAAEDSGSGSESNVSIALILAEDSGSGTQAEDSGSGNQSVNDESGDSSQSGNTGQDLTGTTDRWEQFRCLFGLRCQKAGKNMH